MYKVKNKNNSGFNVEQHNFESTSESHLLRRRLWGKTAVVSLSVFLIILIQTFSLSEISTYKIVEKCQAQLFTKTDGTK